MEWNVFVQNMNKQEIKIWNVFNHSSFKEEVTQLSQKVSRQDYEGFSEGLKRICRYYYWAKCEWEIILGSWPPRIDKEEYYRLNKEFKKDAERFGREPYSLAIELNVEEKVDVYQQLCLNWKAFVRYVRQEVYSNEND